MKSHLAILVFILLSSGALLGQGVNIYAPYISSIRAQSQDDRVIITWQNSRDIEGDLHLFRHTSEITSDNFRSAVPIARIDGNQTVYTDIPPESGNFFYLVLGTDRNGELHRLFIPFRNATTLSVSVKLTETQDMARAEINYIQAETDSDGIELHFTASRADRKLLIHRHTRPIGDLDTIIEATRIASISSALRTYRDTPIPGITYYYSIIDADSLLDGSARFIFGQNSMSHGVRLVADDRMMARRAETIRQRRHRPLPFLLLSSDLSTGSSIRESLSLLAPDPVPLSPAVRDIVSTIHSYISIYRGTIEAVDILAPERMETAFAEQLNLSRIVEQYMLPGDYQKAVTELQAFLAIRRDRDIQYRARYYLGQSYYFQGKWQKAFMEFIVAEEEYYSAVKPWLEDIYYRLRKENT